MYPNLEILRESFLEWLKMRNFAESSLVSYRMYIGKFLSFLESESIEDVRAITPAVILNYQTFLFYSKKKNAEPLSILTQQTALAVVKTFFEFLIKTERMKHDPTSALVMPKKPHTLPEVMTEEETEKLLNAPDTNQIIGFRDRTILEVLYVTGMRSSELCNLKIADVGLREEEIRIRQGKGRKDRLVPVGEIALEFLREYVHIIRPKLAARQNEPRSHVFLSKSGKRITPIALVQLVQKYARKAGLAKHITAHTLRHTCATVLLKHGADIRYIQELLGHTSLESTQIYTRVEITDLKDIHKQYHPREQ